MTLRWALSGKVYFVVMRNFMPARPWLVFDLKGATANRRGLAASKLHQVRNDDDVAREQASAPVSSSVGSSFSAGVDGVAALLSPRRQSSSNGLSNGSSTSVGAPAGSGNSGQRVTSSQVAYPTLRDWEWMDIAMAVDVSAEDKLRIAEAIAADASFLGTQGMLDYSLLVGIHRVSAHLTPRARDAQIELLCRHGGYASVERQKVYFFGIIDVLECYSLRWKMQRLVLNAGYHMMLRGPAAAGISALPPLEYADRFITFALHEALHIADGTVDITSLVGYSAESYGKWRHLWQRRRRGLVNLRIEDDRKDHLRRIEELEREIERLTAPATS